MRKVAIITGITGQDGAYLSNFLSRKKYQIVGLAPIISGESLKWLRYFGLEKKITLLRGDVTDGDFVKKVLKKYQPKEFYNLAGQSSVAKSWQEPDVTFAVNAVSVLSMLNVIRIYSPLTRFFQCSSAEIYGNTKKIITEKSRDFNPVNPYGVSKLAAHLIVENFRREYNLFAVNGILFNHESPLRSSEMVTKKITQGIAAIAFGRTNKLVLGNIDIRRDFGYAGDFVEAMWLMIVQSQPRDFVICTGVSISLVDFLKEAFDYVGIKDWRKFVVHDKKLFRKTDVALRVGSSRGIKQKLGWQPRIKVKELIKIMIDYELSQSEKYL